MPVEDVKRLNAYQAVVLGSGIRVGKWYSEARDFIDDHLQELTRVPVAYFAVCASLMEDTPEKRKEASAYLQEPRAKLKPVDEGLFAGAIDYSKLSFFARMAGKMAKMPEGDYRNWSAIRQWAAGLKQKFQPAQ